jgi:hypothetical protein
MIDPDPDEKRYEIDISKEQAEFFETVSQRHAELFDDDELSSWLYQSFPPLQHMVLRPEGVEEVIQVVVDVWEANGLDIEDARYAEFLDELEIDAMDDDQLPRTLRD